MSGFSWLKRVGAAVRKARPRGARVTGYSPVEYLYVPCARLRSQGSVVETRRWVQEVPIVRKTAKLIYYTSDSWNGREAVVSPGCISRQQFEADTRQGQQRHPGQRGYPAGVIPVPDDRCRGGQAGWLFFATREAAEDHLRRLYLGEREYLGGREYLGERERSASTGPEARLIRELRRAMASAHPDRGGTTERFMRARWKYQAALRRAYG